MDGEIICLDSEGRSQFKELLYRKGRAIFFAFDLLWLNDTDLRKTPLIERKKSLQRLVHRSDCSEMIDAQRVEGQRQADVRGSLREESRRHRLQAQERRLCR